ncbi:hypothetical protein SDC9_123651 [bioreactor metagenome]|uniref:Uncharacterized protein n=1 Tax=bioreactor metagenome TaxID=1076179 RepID=A0A645CIP6_9ZZZZ
MYLHLIPAGRLIGRIHRNARLGVDHRKAFALRARVLAQVHTPSGHADGVGRKARRIDRDVFAAHVAGLADRRNVNAQPSTGNFVNIHRVVLVQRGDNCVSGACAAAHVELCGVDVAGCERGFRMRRLRQHGDQQQYAE